MNSHGKIGFGGAPAQSNTLKKCNGDISETIHSMQILATANKLPAHPNILIQNNFTALTPPSYMPVIILARRRVVPQTHQIHTNSERMTTLQLHLN